MIRNDTVIGNRVNRSSPKAVLLFVQADTPGEDVRVKQRGIPLVVALIAVIALAACGSSSSTAKADSTTSPTSAPSTTGSPTTSGPAAVKTATNVKYGALLVDDKGATLYTLTNNGTPVACTGQCLTFWPPLLLPAGTTTANGAAGVTGLATATTAGGTQVTFKGAPLYRFSADAAAGDANGEGISSFGGVWHVAKTGDAAGASTPTTSGAETTTSTAGYGY
jgi:predicted lipoprotein with Yx(FWY)xxD motif